MANILAFAVAVQRGVALIGVAFYIWVGFFSLSIIAQFWSYANDIYTKDAGNRLFPVIGIGATAGSPLGAWIAGRLFHAPRGRPADALPRGGTAPATARPLPGREPRHHGPPGATAAEAEQAPLGGRSAFSLVFGNRYILLIAVLSSS